MKASAIICEYNPFHNGHKHQIDCIKAHSDNAVVAIMSGNFTQRGDVAIIDKFSRGKIAVENGADLVIELPTVYASSGAESFARGGVQLAKALGCTEKLCFSTEETNTDLLLKTAEAFKNPNLNDEIKKNMKRGNYYPQAVEMAFETIYSKSLAQVITQPNNVLAVEYIKMLEGTDIKPFILERIGTGHHEHICRGNITSGSNLRKMILHNNEDVNKYMPKISHKVFKNPASIYNLEKAVLFKLRTMNVDDFAKLPDVTEGLENRIYEAVRKATSLEELLTIIKTKRYTLARLRRIIICALLGIKSHMTKEDVPYIRVLAFNEKGQELMKEIKLKGTLPLITNVADGYKNLNEKGKEIFNIDLLASDIYSLATDNIEPCGKDFTNGIIKK